MKTLKKIINWVKELLLIEEKKNWKIVVLCIGTATTFWFFNTLNKNDYNTRLNYPVKLVFDDPGDSLIIVEDLPSELSIFVSGRGWNLFRKTLSFNTTPILIDLPSPVDIKFLTNKDLLPKVEQQLTDIKIIDIIDDSVFFNIEKKISKKMAVKINAEEISLENNYKIVSPLTIEPDYVTIAGPTSIINMLPDTLGLSIDEDEIDSNFEDEIETDIYQNELISILPDKVTIAFEVSEYVEKEIVVPVEIINLPDDHSVTFSDSLVSVKFEAGNDRVDEVDNDDFKLTADYQKLNGRDSTLVIEVVKSPEMVSNISITPQAIKVKNAN